MCNRRAGPRSLVIMRRLTWSGQQVVRRHSYCREQRRQRRSQRTVTCEGSSQTLDCAFAEGAVLDDQLIRFAAEARGQVRLPHDVLAAIDRLRRRSDELPPCRGPEGPPRHGGVRSGSTKGKWSEQTLKLFSCVGVCLQSFLATHGP